MALWVCAGPDGCGTKYAVGLFKCPRCLNTEFFEDGDPMAKITRHGGASDHTLPAAPDETAGAAEPPADVAPAPEADEGQPGSVPEPVGEEHGEAVESDGPFAPLPELTGDAEQDSAEHAVTPDYEAWTVEQLKEQLAVRGLPKSGKRDDLVLRLLEDDDTGTAQAQDATE